MNGFLSIINVQYADMSYQLMTPIMKWEREINQLPVKFLIAKDKGAH